MYKIRILKYTLKSLSAMTPLLAFCPLQKFIVENQNLYMTSMYLLFDTMKYIGKDIRNLPLFATGCKHVCYNTKKHCRKKN